jgi:hypothetical protein
MEKSLLAFVWQYTQLRSLRFECRQLRVDELLGVCAFLVLLED